MEEWGVSCLMFFRTLPEASLYYSMARGSSASSRRTSVTSASKRVDGVRKEGVASPQPLTRVSPPPPSPSLTLASLLSGVSSLLTDWDYFPWLSYIIIALEALLGLAIIFIARESIDGRLYTLCKERVLLHTSPHS